jgi:starch synthase (maltosyl-transferring)
LKTTVNNCKQSSTTANFPMSASHAPTVVIENFYPCLEGGRHPVKRVIGEPLDVWCDIFKDGHDVMSAVLRWRLAGSRGAGLKRR